MSSASVLNSMFDFTPAAAEAPGGQEKVKCDSLLWDIKRFGEEQVRALVQRIFFSGAPLGPRQVVFSAVDYDANVAQICLQVGHALATQTSESVCIVEVVPATPASEGFSVAANTAAEPFDRYRSAALILADRLWLLPSDTFLRNEKTLSASCLRSRMDELRLDFDYTIFHAPPAGQSNDAPLLGHLCDGVVLVLTANSTRRVAAKKVKESLYAANARLLGTVLNERTFPIPEGIYRRL